MCSGQTKTAYPVYDQINGLWYNAFNHVGRLPGLLGQGLAGVHTSCGVRFITAPLSYHERAKESRRYNVLTTQELARKRACFSFLL